MNPETLYRLGKASVVDVRGGDAAKIVHNLTTNEVTQLAVGTGCESFVTDVRGKTIGHVVVYRIADGLRLIGAEGQSEALRSHVDRYIIREDAEPQIRDDDFAVFAMAAEAAARLSIATGDGRALVASEVKMGAAAVGSYQVPWLGPGSVALMAEAAAQQSVLDWAEVQSLPVASREVFHQHRVLAGFPWHGTDFDASNLPQEADRDQLAISFVKGCYLGQETVARLDARGQVQKKLVRWSVQGAVPPSGTELTADGKTVGKLTSVAGSGGGDAMAIGMARRSHFESGMSAEGVDSNGARFTAAVI